MALNCQDKEILSWWKLFPEVGVLVDAQSCLWWGESRPWCFFPPAESTELSFCLFSWHSPTELLSARKSSQHGGCKPFPGNLCLSLPVQTGAKPTPFSPSSNSNSTLQSHLVACCAVIASPFLQNCSQGGTAALRSKSQICPGGRRLPPALQVRLCEISAGITTPLASGKF